MLSAPSVALTVPVLVEGRGVDVEALPGCVGVHRAGIGDGAAGPCLAQTAGIGSRCRQVVRPRRDHQVSGERLYLARIRQADGTRVGDGGDRRPPVDSTRGRGEVW
jgi:hypothetical protein